MIFKFLKQLFCSHNSWWQIIPENLDLKNNKKFICLKCGKETNKISLSKELEQLKIRLAMIDRVKELKGE